MNDRTNQTRDATEVGEHGRTVNAARKLAETVSRLQISESSKNVILRIVDWIATKSTNCLDSAVSNFLNSQICRLFDLIEFIVTTSCQQMGLNSTTDRTRPSTRAPVNTYHRSILLQAEAEGVSEEPTEQSHRHQLPVDDRPDVMIDIPHISTDTLTLSLSNLRLHLALDTRIAGDLVRICPTVECSVGQCEVSLEGLRANALAIVRLDTLRQIVESSLDSAAKNPAILGRSSAIDCSSVAGEEARGGAGVDCGACAAPPPVQEHVDIPFT